MNNEVVKGGLAAQQAPVLSMMMMMSISAVVIEDTRIGIGIIVTSDDGNRQTYLVSIN